MRGVLTFLVLLLSACQPDANSARGVAERFLDAHYVNIDLPASKEYCTGLALRRVEDEIRLTEGYAVDANTRKPRVYYRLREERSRGPQGASLLYDATFAVAGAGRFQKKILLTLRQEGEEWRVTNYSEFD